MLWSTWRAVYLSDAFIHHSIQVILVSFTDEFLQNQIGIFFIKNLMYVYISLKRV